MSRFTNNFKPFRRPEARADAREALDFLQSAEKLGALLPTASRLAQLQQACARLQPQVFAACHVVNLDNGQLQIAVPNAALATRLRQQLPRLVAGLRENGWPVEEIRLKVQVMPERLPAPPAATKRPLPPSALNSFADLESSLDSDPRNEALRDALRQLLARRAS